MLLTEMYFVALLCIFDKLIKVLDAFINISLLTSFSYENQMGFGKSRNYLYCMKSSCPDETR